GLAQARRVGPAPVDGTERAETTHCQRHDHADDEHQRQRDEQLDQREPALVALHGEVVQFRTRTTAPGVPPPPSTNSTRSCATRAPAIVAVRSTTRSARAPRPPTTSPP